MLKRNQTDKGHPNLDSFRQVAHLARDHSHTIGSDGDAQSAHLDVVIVFRLDSVHLHVLIINIRIIKIEVLGIRVGPIIK